MQSTTYDQFHICCLPQLLWRFPYQNLLFHYGVLLLRDLHPCLQSNTHKNNMNEYLYSVYLIVIFTFFQLISLVVYASLPFPEVLAPTQGHSGNSSVILFSSSSIWAFLFLVLAGNCFHQGNRWILLTPLAVLSSLLWASSLGALGRCSLLPCEGSLLPPLFPVFIWLIRESVRLFKGTYLAKAEAHLFLRFTYVFPCLVLLDLLK